MLQSTHNNDAHHEEELKKTDTTTFGFWLYIMTDCILFATLFTVFIVLSRPFVPYPFDINLVMTETFILLSSSFTFGLAVAYMRNRSIKWVFFWMFITFILGCIFVALEAHEFLKLISEGNTWSKNAYFSSFFVLVGTHGAHVIAGLIWMVSLSIQICKHGINETTSRKLGLLSLFWHFLDIVWIFVFSIVYLIGSL